MHFVGSSKYKMRTQLKFISLFLMNIHKLSLEYKIIPDLISLNGVFQLYLNCTINVKKFFICQVFLDHAVQGRI